MDKINYLARDKKSKTFARREAITDGCLDIIAEDISDKKPNFTEFIAVRKL